MVFVHTSSQRVVGPEILLSLEPKVPGHAISFCVPKAVTFKESRGLNPVTVVEDKTSIQGLQGHTL